MEEPIAHGQNSVNPAFLPNGLSGKLSHTGLKAANANALGFAIQQLEINPKEIAVFLPARSFGERGSC